MPEQQRYLSRQLQKRQFKYLLRQLGTKLLDSLQPIIIFGGLLIVLTTKIPWFKNVLTRIGISDPNSFAQTMLLIVLAAIFIEVRGIAQRVSEIPDQRHYGDPLEVYPALFEQIQQIKRKEEKTLDVLGLDLYTAWPSIGFFLHRPELRDWTIRMTAVARADSGVMELFPNSWVVEGRKNLQQVYDSQNSEVITSQNIVLEPYGYDFVPVIHGFRLGNGALFYSMLMWGPDGKISREIYSYEHLPANDRSSSAEWVRQIFDSWFERACRDKWPPPQGAERSLLNRRAKKGSGQS